MTLPPVTPPAPAGWGEDVASFLAHHGYFAVTPHIRSSDFYLCLTDPFRYYVERRYGLRSAFDSPAALVHGSWMHTCFEVDDFTQPVLSYEQLMARIRPTLEARLAELKVLIDTFNMSPETGRRILDTEEQDAQLVATWYTAARTIPFGHYRNFAHFLGNPNFRILEREFPITVPGPDSSWPSFSGRMDSLLYRTDTNLLYVVDYKSTAKSCVQRLSVCPAEFQTHHYARLLLAVLPSVREKHNLPADVRIGGVIHIAVRKPTIKLSSEDRSYKIVDFTPSRGPNKGITRPQYEYEGEPSFTNYLKRVTEQYTATGRYVSDHVDRQKDPWVNTSFTPAHRPNPYASPGILDSEMDFRYNTMSELIKRYATSPLRPDAFPQNPLTLVASFADRLTPWGALALTHPKSWPSVIRDERLIITHRDEHNHDDKSNNP
jgi:hypothetical protein